MREFNYAILKDQNYDNEILEYVVKIYEYKAKQRMFVQQNPAGLEKLVEIAKIQSTEFSNKIEGIRTTSTRLKNLIMQKTTPKNRVEEEIAGYRDVLNTIHENYQFIEITPNFILQLHRMLFKYSPKSIGGKFKSVQNYISITSGGQTCTLFTPLAPYETPQAVEKICQEFNNALAQGEVNPLILIATFVHDFLCIHPFLDGNGRISRLLTTLLLYKTGFFVCKYISLEALIAKNKELYYSSLQNAQKDWHIGQDNKTQFIKYLLGIVLGGYREFEERAMIFGKSLAGEVVENAVNNQIGKFTKMDIANLCPTIGVKSVERALKQMLDADKIEKFGKGKNTYYVKTTD